MTIIAPFTSKGGQYTTPEPEILLEVVELTYGKGQGVLDTVLFPTAPHMRLRATLTSLLDEASCVAITRLQKEKPLEVTRIRAGGSMTTTERLWLRFFLSLVQRIIACLFEGLSG